MGILARHSLQSPWQLTAQGLGQSPSWAAGTNIYFNLNDMPAMDRATGRKLNYVPALCLTVYGFVTTTGSLFRVRWEDLMAGLFDSFDMIGAFHGRPVNLQAFRGVTARIWEYIGMGWQPGARRMAPIRGASAGRNFRLTCYIPLSFLIGDDPLYTAMPAFCYRTAQLNIRTAAASTVMPNGDTLSAVTANINCSAVLVPQDTLRLPPAQEWIEFDNPGAQATSPAVQLQAFGDATSLDGVQPQAAISTMLLLSSVENIGGAWNGSQLTQLWAPFLGINPTSHLDPFFQNIEQASGYGQRPHDGEVQDDLVDGIPTQIGNVVDTSGFPYTQALTANADNQHPYKQALAAGFIVPGARMQVTKLPVFGETVNYYRSVSALDGAVDRTLVHQFKSWAPAKIDDFVSLAAKEGVLQALYGTNNVSPLVATNDANNIVRAKDTRFLPLEFAPPAAAAAK
jgi:hypothetical protein